MQNFLAFEAKTKTSASKGEAARAKTVAVIRETRASSHSKFINVTSKGNKQIDCSEKKGELLKGRTTFGGVARIKNERRAAPLPELKVRVWVPSGHPCRSICTPDSKRNKSIHNNTHTLCKLLCFRSNAGPPNVLPKRFLAVAVDLMT